MRVGFGRECVNPPLGMAMEGLGQKTGIASIHDDLYLQALYLEDGATRVLIVGMDLLFFEMPVIERMKREVGSALALAPEAILINTSHTHAGPRLTRWSYSGAPEAAYLDTAIAALVKAAKAAASKPVDATMWAGTANTDLPVSRRKIDANGKAQWAPNRSAEVCHALPFCLFRDGAGRVISVLYSVSCHPSMVYSADASGDYVGAATRKLNAYFKTEGAIFLQGAGGDTKPRQIAVEEDHWRPATWDEVEAAGAEVAEAVIAAERAGVTRIEPALSTVTTVMDWTFERGPAEAELKALEADPGVRPERRLWVQEMLSLYRENGALPAAAPVTLHAIQLGRGLRLVGLAGELVGELGNLVLRAYDKGITFPLGYTDGCVIYLPSDRMLPQGGYEVDSYWEYHWPAPLAKGIDERLLGAMKWLEKQGIANTAAR